MEVKGEMRNDTGIETVYNSLNKVYNAVFTFSVLTILILCGEMCFFAMAPVEVRGHVVGVRAPSTMRVPGIELGSSGLSTRCLLPTEPFHHQAIELSLVLSLCEETEAGAGAAIPEAPGRDSRVSIFPVRL